MNEWTETKEDRDRFSFILKLNSVESRSLFKGFSFAAHGNLEGSPKVVGFSIFVLLIILFFGGYLLMYFSFLLWIS